MLLCYGRDAAHRGPASHPEAWLGRGGPGWRGHSSRYSRDCLSKLRFFGRRRNTSSCVHNKTKMGLALASCCERLPDLDGTSCHLKAPGSAHDAAFAAHHWVVGRRAKATPPSATLARAEETRLFRKEVGAF